MKRKGFVLWLSLFLALLPVAGLPARTPRVRDWATVRSWVYQLQKADLKALEEAPADLLVIDYSLTGADDRALTRQQVERLQRSGKLVLAYLSIGEAEEYRYYWKPGWKPGKPEWIRDPNPHWPDNFPVQYWHPEWQALLFRGSDSYLDRILRAGFDGVYLDIVDGYWPIREERPSSAEEMKQLVRDIASHARAEAGEDFGVFPQNAVGLLDDPEYRRFISGLGKEETYFFPDDTRPSENLMNWQEKKMDLLVSEGKPVLTVDYCQDPEHRRWVRNRARRRGYIPYLAHVKLDRLQPQP